MGPTQNREHLAKISSPESRRKGGFGSAHKVHGWHRLRFNPLCHWCQKEREELKRNKQIGEDNDNRRNDSKDC
jgi:hypothetical protein